MVLKGEKERGRERERAERWGRVLYKYKKAREREKRSPDDDVTTDE